MTDEQIIEMARQSGLHVATDVNWMPVIGLAYAKKLVEVAAQHEREACAKVCDEHHGYMTGIVSLKIRARSKP